MAHPLCLAQSDHADFCCSWRISSSNRSN
jgi:hypothetical protein